MAKLTYKKIKNFLNETELNLLSTYCKLRCRFPSNENISWNNPDKPANFKFNFKSDTIMESLLLTKQKKVEEILGEKLWPTYSFWRPYFLGNDLSAIILIASKGRILGTTMLLTLPVGS